MEKLDELRKQQEKVDKESYQLQKQILAEDREERFKKYKGLYKYRIVNGELVEIPKDSIFKVEFPDGLPVMIDDYGMGSCHWSLIEKKEDAQKRQLMDNVLWAVGRLKWAVSNNSKEVEELKEIIVTGGQSRFPSEWKGF